MNEDREKAYAKLVKCDSCQVEATRDVWLKWGSVCHECKKVKTTLY